MFEVTSGYKVISVLQIQILTLLSLDACTSGNSTINPRRVAFFFSCRIKCTLKLSCDSHDKRSVGCCGANVTERV